MFKALHFFTILFCASSLLAQDWQTLQSNSIKYYQNNYDLIYGVKFDSVKLDNNDSIFYPYKTLRNYSDTGPSSGPCQFKRLGAWFGERIIIKPNGDNIIINRFGHEILIKTLANLGDTFTIYHYPNGDSIEATVTNIDVETHLGITDSIKTFKLFQNGGFTFQNSEIKLGKKIGFTSILPFYKFPYQHRSYPMEANVLLSYDPLKLVGQDNPRLGITRPTYSDIFNYEIGDVILYEENGYTQLNILDKNNMLFDSTTYKLERKKQLTDSSGVIHIEIDTLYISYNTSDEYYSQFMPDEFNQEYFDATFRVQGLTMYTKDCGYYQLSWKYYNQFYLYNPLNDCFYQSYYDHSVNYQAVYSNGGDYYYTIIYNGFGSNTPPSSSLIYKSNQQYGCGSKWFLNTTSLNEINKPKVFPNPTSDLLHIESVEPINEIELYNLAGQLLFSIPYTNKINLNDLSEGTYILLLKSVSNVYKRKIVKI